MKQPRTAMSTEYYCPEHKYNPPENSGFCFCPECELAGPTGSAIPRALFSCSNESCAAENSYHADQLFWYANTQRWVCENCWYYLPYHHPRGITLEDYIIKGGFSAALLVLNKR